MKIKLRIIVELIFIIMLSLSIHFELKISSVQNSKYLNSSNRKFAPETSNDQVLIPSVPFHYQINEYFCGPAALEMIFDYYGPDISQEEIAEVARTYQSESGTYWFELRRAGHFSDISSSRGLYLSGSINGYSNRKIGYTSFETHLDNTTCLKYLIDEGYPILVITWSGFEHDAKHFRVVTGYTYENDEIQDFILNDPWIGPDFEMRYNDFVDLWSSNGNWSLFVSPWIVNVTYPTNVQVNSDFQIIATFQYPCPLFFNEYMYSATNCNATIKIPSGFSLIEGESETKQLNNGTLNPKNITTCKWNITSGSENSLGVFTIEGFGEVSGTVPQHNIFVQYSYTDRVGGSKHISIEISGGFPTQTVVIIIVGGIIGVAFGASLFFIIRWKKRRNNI